MWRPRIALLVAAATVVAACSTDTDRPGDDPHADDRAGGDPAATCDASIDGALGAWAEAGFSGSVTVSTGGELDCVAAYGTADEATDTPNAADTVFSIGSVSKAFTAAAVLDLVESGRLSLTDRAGGIVDGLGGAAADATVEQLLLHTSGLTGSHGQDHEPLAHDEAVAALSRLETAFDPGTDYLYSNAGYTLLALIVEAASGRDYRDHLASDVLPLPDGRVAGGFWDGEPAAPGPRAVGYLDGGPTDQMGDAAGPHWALAGNGDLAMTMPDLASWTHALFTGGIVAPEAVDAIVRPGFDHGDGTQETPGWVAVDASAFGEPFLTAAGGGGDIGHDTVVVWLPESERAVAVASNTPDVTAGDLVRAVGPALAAGDPLPTPGTVRDVDPAQVAEVSGTYTLDTGGSFQVAGRDARVTISARGADAVAALFPPPAGVDAEDVAMHERNVTTMLAGETPAGREERAALESSVGAIGEVALAGTVVEDGELRTYVAIGPDGSLLAWYALDDEGGVAAAEVQVEPPTLVLGLAADGRFRPDDPAGTGPEVSVSVEGAGLTVSGPDGETRARLAR